MTAEELRGHGLRLYGPMWRSRLAIALDVNIRTVQRWGNGQNLVPDAIAAAVLALVEARDIADDLAR